MTELLFPKLTFIAALLVKLSAEKNFCRAVWADAALSSCSCCKTYSTATRAKSKTSSVIAKAEVGFADAELEVAEAVTEGAAEES